MTLTHKQQYTIQQPPYAQTLCRVRRRRFLAALGRWRNMLLNRCGSIMNSKLIVGKQSLVDVGVFGTETAYCDIALELVLGDVFFNHVDSNLRSPLFGEW